LRPPRQSAYSIMLLELGLVMVFGFERLLKQQPRPRGTKKGGNTLKPAIRDLCLVALAALAATAPAKDFSVADLDKMVTELMTVMAKDPKLTYPVKCSVETNKSINAYSTARKEAGSDKPRATMVVYSGLVDFLKGDIKLIRAVVAHEIGHLAKGHCSGYGYVGRDLDLLHTRQQEYEADMTGAIALQRLGYGKQDMVDMLMALGKIDGRKGNWWDNLTADHADPKARAAEIADNPSVLKSLLAFDMGLAFADSRRWKLAGRFFDDAVAKEPRLLEAYVNSANAALMYYYDLLPLKARENWLRPDFGALLQDPVSVARAAEIDDTDRARYREAVAKINIAIDKAPSISRSKELLALAQVLEPDGDKSTVQKGIDAFKSMLSSETDDYLKLRWANNAAVGLDRLDNLDAAYDLLISAARKNNYFIAAHGENLGRISVKNRSEADDKLALDIFYTWLIRSPSIAPNWDVVKAEYDKVAAKLGLSVKKPEPAATLLCKAGSIFVGGKELGLFRPSGEYLAALGKPDRATGFEEQYPDLLEAVWKGGDVSVLIERDKILRITSYQAGSYVMLQPREKTSSSVFLITVGMTEADLNKILPPSGAKTKLIKGGELEEWTYWSGLNMGVLLADGKVKGITVTPVAED
jgi:hypothetical protein